MLSSSLQRSYARAEQTQNQFLFLRTHFQSRNLQLIYGEFYKEQTVSRIIEAAKKLTLSWHHTLDFSKFTFCHIETREDWLACYDAVQNKNFFLAIPKFIRSELKNELHYSIEIDFENKFLDEKDFIEISTHHKNPIQFVVDHESYWDSRKIARILTQEENFSKPGVGKVVQKKLKEDNNEFSKAAILGLGKVMACESLKEKAKKILLEAALFDNFKLSGTYKIREFVWKQLKPILHEQDVQAVFKKIAIQDPRICFKFSALNYLEGIDGYAEELNAEILKNIILNFDVETLMKEQGRALESILWAHLPYSYQAICLIGEEIWTRSILDKFLKMKNVIPSVTKGCSSRKVSPLGGIEIILSETAYLYSILNFIGINTSNQELFNAIVSGLIEVVAGKHIGMLESLSFVLYQFENNKSVNMSPLQGILIERWRPGAKTKRSPIGSMNENTHKLYKKLNFEALIAIIKSTNYSLPHRKIAIRYCELYLFAQHVSSWEKREYLEYGKQIVPYLEELESCDSVDEELKSEAKKLLAMYRSSNSSLSGKLL